MQDKDARLDKLPSRQEIDEVVTRSSRDANLLRSDYREAGLDDDRIYKGAGNDLAAWTVEWERENIRACRYIIDNRRWDLKGEFASGTASRSPRTGTATAARSHAAISVGWIGGIVCESWPIPSSSSTSPAPIR
jgi:hypothetical protein